MARAIKLTKASLAKAEADMVALRSIVYDMRAKKKGEAHPRHGELKEVQDRVWRLRATANGLSMVLGDLTPA